MHTVKTFYRFAQKSTPNSIFESEFYWSVANWFSSANEYCSIIIENGIKEIKGISEDTDHTENFRWTWISRGLLKYFSVITKLW